jgi:flagellar biosynthesis protein FliR
MLTGNPQLSFLSLGIASAIATAIMVKATNAINKYGEPIGVSATKGTVFLGMAWGATAAMLVASIVAVAQVLASHRERKFRQSKI